MKLILRFSIIVSVTVAAIAIGAFVYVMAGYFLAAPFMQVLNPAEYRDLTHLCGTWAAYSLIAIVVTVWLWRTYRRESMAAMVTDP